MLPLFSSISSYRFKNLFWKFQLRSSIFWIKEVKLHYLYILWAWYSNVRRVVKETPHLCKDSLWDPANYIKKYILIVSWFFASDLWRIISRCNHAVFHLKDPKDLSCAYDYAVTVSNRFSVLGTLRTLWNTLKCKTFQAGNECIGEWAQTRSGFAWRISGRVMLPVVLGNRTNIDSYSNSFPEKRRGISGFSLRILESQTQWTRVVQVFGWLVDNFAYPSTLHTGGTLTLFWIKILDSENHDRGTLGLSSP